MSILGCDKIRSMCGRAYSSYTAEELEANYSRKRPFKIEDFPFNFNLAPSQTSLVMRIVDGKTRFDQFRWGLVPFWAKDLKIGYKMINARSETVAEKPSFRTPYKKRRCIVPLSGFIEWKRDGDSKQPYAIYLKENPIMSLAGLWEEWKSEKGEIVESFTILTTEANKFMAKIHDRMPVLLSEADEDKWLDPENDTAKGLDKLLRPCPDKWLAAHKISTLINSPKNNKPELLKDVG